MYVLRTTMHHMALIEMTPTEYRETIDEEARASVEQVKRVRHQRITADEARRYVKAGGHHETGLWVDADGKVRYAHPDPASYTHLRAHETSQEKKKKPATILNHLTYRQRHLV
ncbi:hypothetical protein EHS39_36205, partial [Ensifer sp. MPMI2T]